ncbi:MAG: class I SAM-dependent rRNA methyltransferase [Deltaproteobacteria bacterium]|nr:class I SAM-dependent rRNA methyltransferase [Deltaproteobacteria bacterium]
MTEPTPIPTVRLTQPFKIQHPWIFARAVAKPAERIPPGTVVEVLGVDGSFVGRGFYNGHSRIGVRLLTTDQGEQVDAAFFASRIERAIEWRRHLGLFQKTTGMRLIHSEGDGLSGLIVDLLGGILAIQFTSAGMFRQREQIKSILLSHFPEARVYWFAEKRIQKQESFDCWEIPAPDPVVIEEQGVRFHVAVGSKHKTGFFADQRENRLHLASLSAGKDILDVCCHTGGFGLYAKVIGHAKSVTGIDLDDAEALTTARANASLNGVDINFIAADASDYMKQAALRGDRYDVVVLDPAKQTRSADKIDGALNEYWRLNRLALPLVKPGGILLTCSCSGLISEDEFLGTIKQAARDERREAQIFRLSGAAPDHPFLAHVGEGRYLKAVWARIT